MAGENPQVQGRPTPKFGLTGPSFPTQAGDDVTLTEEVAYAVMANGAADLKIPAFGTPHPRSQAHRLIAVACLGGNEGKIWYRLTFSKLPGHLLPGSSVSEQTWGAPAVVTKQNVLAGTAPQTGIGVIQSDVQPQDAQTAVATATTVTWPTLTTTRINERGDPETVVQTKVAPGTALPEFNFTTVSITQQAETKDRATLAVASVASYSTLTDNEGIASNRGLLHFIAGAQKTTTHNVVSPGTDPDTGLNVVESAVHAKNTAQSDKTTTRVVAWPTLNSSAVIDSQAHGADTTTVEKVVTSGSPADISGYTLANIIEAEVNDTDGTHSIQKIKVLGNGTNTAWPILTEEKVDPELNVIIVTTRQKVPIGATVNVGAVIQNTQPAIIVTSIEPVENNINLKWEVITTIPLPSANSYSTAVMGMRTTADSYPDLLDVAAAMAGYAAGNFSPTSGMLIYTQRKGQLIIANSREWWALSTNNGADVQAAVAKLVTQIIPDNVSVSNGSLMGVITYNNVLHDPFMTVYLANEGYSEYVVPVPASTPSFSAYSGWVKAKKLITLQAEVVAQKYNILFKVRILETVAR